MLTAIVFLIQRGEQFINPAGHSWDQFLWRSVYLLKLPRLAKKTRVALSWVLEMIFSKDLEQMLALRDVELISRIATSLRRDVAD